jgi:hypothetical protein
MFFIQNLDTNEKITLITINDDDGFLGLAFRSGELVYRSEYSAHNSWNGQAICLALSNTARSLWGNTEICCGFA